MFGSPPQELAERCTDTETGGHRKIHDTKNEGRTCGQRGLYEPGYRVTQESPK